MEISILIEPFKTARLYLLKKLAPFVYEINSHCLSLRAHLSRLYPWEFLSGTWFCGVCVCVCVCAHVRACVCVREGFAGMDCRLPWARHRNEMSSCKGRHRAW